MDTDPSKITFKDFQLSSWINEVAGYEFYPLREIFLLTTNLILIDTISEQFLVFPFALL